MSPEAKGRRTLLSQGFFLPQACPAGQSHLEVWPSLTWVPTSPMDQTHLLSPKQSHPVCFMSHSPDFILRPTRPTTGSTRRWRERKAGSVGGEMSPQQFPNNTFINNPDACPMCSSAWNFSIEKYSSILYISSLNLLCSVFILLWLLYPSTPYSSFKSLKTPGYLMAPYCVFQHSFRLSFSFLNTFFSCLNVSQCLIQYNRCLLQKRKMDVKRKDDHDVFIHL